MKNSVSFLTRGVAEILIKEDLEKELGSGKKLRVKLGIDPTAPDLHLGHTVPLRTLRAFQDTGHQAVLIIGDFTALIGDPSGRLGARTPLTKEQIEKNLEHFLAQAGKVLNLKTLEVRRNSGWFLDMRLPDVLALHARFTLQQLSQREDFAKRVREENPVGLHELDYPLLQAYDSVMVQADAELGGIDQKLNLLAGRHLMEKMGLAPQHIIMTPLLLGTDGVKKMSKSLGNYIGLQDEPNDMFGKLMAVPDALVPSYFELLTDSEVPHTKNPRDAKLTLAKTIVSLYHGTKAGERAETFFIKTFSKKEVPEDIPELRINNKVVGIMELLIAAGVQSKSEARRLIAGGAIKIDGMVKKNPEEMMLVHDNAVFQIGKRKFFKLRFEKIKRPGA